MKEWKRIEDIPVAGGIDSKFEDGYGIHNRCVGLWTFEWGAFLGCMVCVVAVMSSWTRWIGTTMRATVNALGCVSYEVEQASPCQPLVERCRPW